MKKIILGLVIVLGLGLGLSFCIVGSVNANWGQLYYSSTGLGGSRDSSNSGNSSKCTDSDGGKDAYVKGTTCVRSSCQADKCHEGATVLGYEIEPYLAEYYCGRARDDKYYGDEDVVDVIMRARTICPNGCKDGACVRKGVTYAEPEVGTETGTGVGSEDCAGDGEVLYSFGAVKNECCAGLHEISSGYRNGVAYCTSEVCGNGACSTLENKYNCSQDCDTTTQPVSVDVQPIITMIRDAIEKLNSAIRLLGNLI